MIYANFQSILVPENNRKRNPDESYTNKYQNPVGSCSTGYKLVCVGGQFSKHFKSYSQRRKLLQSRDEKVF